MMGKRFLVLSLLVIGFTVPAQLWSSGAEWNSALTPPTAQDLLPAKGAEPIGEKEDQDRMRWEQNLKDFRQLMLVDSVGWLKVNAIKRPDESMDQLQKERTQRKVSALKEFCGEPRFEKLAEVDSVKQMTAEERTFCKGRLKLSNPLIP